MTFMCNKRIEHLEESPIDYKQLQHQAVFTAMNNSNKVNLGSVETPRVKFLCSFGGSILPRPQDGKLRYVGGETRILSVPHDIGYEELMTRMRELYEAASILKYQQPDEDLDALVSVVNDDDVTNMMEEYDKLGSEDGFTRIRIFLFSHPDQDASPHYMDEDERDNERRYVDALNSLNEPPEYTRPNPNDSPTLVDEVHIVDQFFNSMNLEGSVYNQRNYEMAMPQYNLRQLAIPSMGSGQHSAPFAPRYNEDAPWCPAYYSPRCAGPHDTHTFTEFLSSPSSVRYRVPFQETPDKCTDTMHDESNHQQVNSQTPFDLQRLYLDKVVWLPAGEVPVDRGGFPGNIFNGTSVCEHCKMTFQRNPSSSDFHWKPEEQSYLEQSTIGNGFPQVMNPCVECHPNREFAMVNTDSRLHHGIYNEEQFWADEPRAHMSGVGRMGDHYTLDGTGTNIPLVGENLPDGHLVSTTGGHLEDPHHIRTGAELGGGEVFRGQAVDPGSHVHTPLEEQGVRSANLPYSYGADIPHQVLHGHPSGQAMWRNAPNAVKIPPAYNSSNLQLRNDIPSGVIPRGAVEASPRFFVGVGQSHHVESSNRRLGVDGSTPEYPYSHISKLNHGAPFHESQTFAQDPLRNQLNTLNIPPLPPEYVRSSELPSTILKDKLLSSSAGGYSPLPREDTGVRLDERVEHLDAGGVHPPQQNNNTHKIFTTASLNPIKSNSSKSANEFKDGTHPGETNTCPPKDNTDLTFLPELIASAKKAKLESVKIVKARAQEDSDSVILQRESAKITDSDETPDINGKSEGGSENEYSDPGKIEPTKAEEEAIARGLQTIRNDDLEEIRELGSGTYGAVYHGKWKGSDVAIKRIKASCFAGRPSERERLIADFWKEALILSSLHHPNVVSFYGIVRDGPDGSLATVTEFMVNGSLKQYLRKKDRTIDRRKRLIIAMDAAFGMEYLHEKNIVHFDLKCENLLVNMRDTHRPVCKIGDMGLSKVKQHTLVSGGVRGTLPWMAPELLSGKCNMVTEKIDVYSFGIVMWELLTGEEPYSDRHCASIIGGIVNNTLRPQIPMWCDPEWKSLMGSCWASDPEERPSFSEISQRLRTMAAAMNLK